MVAESNLGAIGKGEESPDLLAEQGRNINKIILSG
jgi:hypothetical protein